MGSMRGGLYVRVVTASVTTTVACATGCARVFADTAASAKFEISWREIEFESEVYCNCGKAHSGGFASFCFRSFSSVPHLFCSQFLCSFHIALQVI